MLEFKMKDLTPYTFKIPEPMLSWLKECAARNHTTVSQMLRDLVMQRMRVEPGTSDHRLAG